MRDSQREFESAEILSDFVENLHSSDRDLFDGIQPGRLSRADMELLDLVLFMTPAASCTSDDHPARLWATAVKSRQLAGIRLQDEGEGARPISRFLSSVARLFHAAAAFAVALIAEPVPGSLELRSIDTSGQVWYKLHAAGQAPAVYGGSLDTRYATCRADVFIGFRAVA